MLANCSPGIFSKRNGGKQIWFDAMTKEQTGLDERGVFEYVTKQETKDRGYPDPIDMQCLFDTKINPDGSFAKVKARSVLRGDTAAAECCMQKHTEFQYCIGIFCMATRGRD